MNSHEIRATQRELNAFTKRCLHGVTPLIVDGELGPATDRRVKYAKYWLGHARPFGPRISAHLRDQLRHPHKLKFSTAAELCRGAIRRRKSRRKSRANERRARRTTGVSAYRGGRPVANWMHPYLDWAREHGWQGMVVSGFRDPAFSESLCYRICNAPRCSGTCAGRSSGHSQSTKPGGCIDVSDYTRFGQLMRACPFSPRLINDLPIDRVHFSVSGH